MSPLQRTKRKFVLASVAKTEKILFRYMAPEQVPILYGGLSGVCGDCNLAFTNNDPASKITIRPLVKYTLRIPVRKMFLGSLFWITRFLISKNNCNEKSSTGPMEIWMTGFLISKNNSNEKSSTGPMVLPSWPCRAPSSSLEYNSQ
ncbi:hypothetical protein POM88_033230 [Heracleum sosnowskyi]|uniref:Uncharacterized protein n=1 Tax=Heracleum sosnowskyi TaxID=360622 RepID=A0AAD8I2W9_9APIA|nr:hypothetical protein POM88_033230 [Heracleum sosnowskyi]